MPVLFENELFRVSQAWLGGWRVLFKPSGSILVPDQQLSIQMGLVWKLVRSRKYRAMAPPGDLAEIILFETFAVCTLDPQSDEAIMFKGKSPESVAFAIVSEANIEDVASRL